MTFSQKLKYTLQDFKKSMEDVPKIDFSKSGLYSYEHSENLKNKHISDLKTKAINELEYLQDSVNLRIETKQKKINELEFPALTSFASQQRGENQRSEALTIIKDKNFNFIKAIQDAEKLDRIDFIYSLRDFLNNSDVKSDMRTEINNKINEIGEKRGLTTLYKDIENLNQFNELLSTHKKIIQENEINDRVSLMYFPELEIKEEILI